MLDREPEAHVPLPISPTEPRKPQMQSPEVPSFQAGSVVGWGLEGSGFTETVLVLCLYDPGENTPEHICVIHINLLLMGHKHLQQITAPNAVGNANTMARIYESQHF